MKLSYFIKCTKLGLLQLFVSRSQAPAIWINFLFLKKKFWNLESNYKTKVFNFHMFLIKWKVNTTDYRSSGTKILQTTLWKSLDHNPVTILQNESKQSFVNDLNRIHLFLSKSQLQLFLYFFYWAEVILNDLFHAKLYHNSGSKVKFSFVIHLFSNK